MSMHDDRGVTRLSGRSARSTHIVLVGLPGSGKSVVGFSLARRLGRPFFDVNSSSESPSGHHIPVTRSRDGNLDDAVGARERNWFERIVATSTGAVVAAPWAAAQMLPHAHFDRTWIAVLDVSLDVVRERLARDGTSPTACERLAQLAGEHAMEMESIRRSADVTIDTVDRSINEIADRLDAAWSSAVVDD